MKIERGVLTVAPRPMVPVDKMFTVADLVKLRHDLYLLEWPLAVILNVTKKGVPPQQKLGFLSDNVGQKHVHASHLVKS